MVHEQHVIFVLSKLNRQLTYLPHIDFQLIPQKFYMCKWIFFNLFAQIQINWQRDNFSLNYELKN